MRLALTVVGVVAGIIIAAIALIQLSGSLQIALTGLGGGLSIGAIWTFVRGNKQITSR